MSLTAIVCCYPQTTHEILFAGADANLFALSLQRLLITGTIENVVISTSQGLHDDARMRLEAMGFEVEYSSYAQPQRRIAEIVVKRNLDRVCILNGYSFFIDPVVTDSLEAEVLGGSSLACAGLESPFRYQCVVDRPTAVAMAEEESGYANPLKLHTVKATASGGRSVAPPDVSAFVGVDGVLWLILLHAVHHGDHTVVDAIARRVASGLPLETACIAELQEAGLDLTAPGFAGRHGEIFKLCSLIQEYVFVWRVLIANVKKNRFLEIGYGDSPYSAYLMGTDFAQGVAVEPFSISDHPDFCANRSLLTGLLPGLCSLLPAFRLRQEQAPSISFVPEHLEECGFDDESFDFCYSVTVLEHVDSLVPLMNEAYRVLAPGGTMCHIVDYTGHGYCKDNCYPFYSESKESWLRKSQYINLMRHGEVVRILEDIGFEVSVLHREESTLMPSKIDADWKEYGTEDLVTAKASYWCVKR